MEQRLRSYPVTLINFHGIINSGDCGSAWSQEKITYNILMPTITRGENLSETVPGHVQLEKSFSCKRKRN